MNADLRFQELLAILRRRLRLILGFAACGTLLAWLAGQLIGPRYTATAQLVVEPQRAGAFAQADAVDQPAGDATVDTQVKLLTSADHLRHVIELLSGGRDIREAALGPAARPGTALGQTWRRLGTWLPASLPASTSRAEDAVPRRPVAGGASTEVSAEELDRRLKVYQEGHSFIIDVSFTAGDANEAAVVANRVAETYVQSQLARKRADTDRSLRWLNDQLQQLKGGVEQAEAAVQQYRIEHGLAGANRTDVTDQQIAGLNQQLVAAESDLAARQMRLAHIRDLQHEGSSSAALGGILNSATIAELQRQEAELLRTQAELATSLGSKHPKMLVVLAQLRETRGKINDEVARIIGNLENEVEIAAAQVRSIQDRLEGEQRLSHAAGAAEVRLHEIEREAAASQQLYQDLLQRQKAARAQQADIEPDVRVLSEAVPPTRPSSPGPILFLLPGLVASTTLGGLLAILLDRLDRGLRTERDVSGALGVPYIGVVPRLKRPSGKRPHMYLLNEPQAAYAEAIRSVFTALQLAVPRGAAKVILVTSSVPGEGKTTLAVSLAAYAASIGHRALLIDFDLRQPMTLRELGGGGETGLLEILLDNRPFARVMQRLPGLGLDYLPARPSPTDPLTLFTKGRVTKLLDELRECYDCVIIDSPPVLAATEVRVLASIVDKVLFAVKWGTTDKRVAQHSLELLRDPDSPAGSRNNIAGAVLTQVDPRQQKRYGDVGELLVKYQGYYAN